MGIPLTSSGRLWYPERVATGCHWCSRLRIGGAMARKRRLSITLTFPMEAAIRHEAVRNGLHDSTMACVLLRRALDKVIESEEIKRQVKVHVAEGTPAEWRHEATGEQTIAVARAQIESQAVG